MLDWLRAGCVVLELDAGSRDVLAADQPALPGPRVIRSDGAWAWVSDVEYYLEQYDLLLPEELLAHIRRLGYQAPAEPDRGAGRRERWARHAQELLPELLGEG